MTATQIFEANQALTVESLASLKGQKIAAAAHGSKYNAPYVEEITVGEVVEDGKDRFRLLDENGNRTPVFFEKGDKFTWIGDWGRFVAYVRI